MAECLNLAVPISFFAVPTKTYIEKNVYIHTSHLWGADLSKFKVENSIVNLTGPLAVITTFGEFWKIVLGLGAGLIGFGLGVVLTSSSKRREDFSSDAEFKKADQLTRTNIVAGLILGVVASYLLHKTIKAEIVFLPQKFSVA